MKRCHFNSRLAKLLLPAKSTAITLFYHSFFKEYEYYYSCSDVKHEEIHQVQQIDCTTLGLFLGMFICGVLGGSVWWIPILGFSTFYIWYVVEYLVIKIFAKWDNQNKSYHDISFEEEAFSGSSLPGYLEDRWMFAWIKYIKLRSYKE